MSVRVLIAEDDDAVRRSLASALTRSGFEVVAVDDGAPAIELASTNTFEILLVDLNMKTIGGIAVARFYKRLFGAAVSCIVLSGDDSADMRAACSEAGVSDIILKPTTPSELRRRLFAVANRLQAA